MVCVTVIPAWDRRYQDTWGSLGTPAGDGSVQHLVLEGVAAASAAKGASGPGQSGAFGDAVFFRWKLRAL